MLWVVAILVAFAAGRMTSPGPRRAAEGEVPEARQAGAQVAKTDTASLWTEGRSPQESRSALGADVASSRRNAITEAVAKVSPAVVGINVTQIREVTPWNPFFDDPFFRQFLPRYQQVVKSLGSGFLISKDGYIVTNEHVVHQASEVVVTLVTGEHHKARLIGADYTTDVALLKIDANRELPYARLGDSDDVIIGEWVVALGNPFGLFEINAQPIVTVGVVSAVNQDFGRQVSDRVYQDMIQTDAAVNSGNSGGPLVNILGEVIGVNTWIISASENTGANIGLNFAIPINRVKRVLNDLRRYGQVNRSFWTGLEVENINPAIARYLGLRTSRGVIVADVKKNSPAERAGIRPGDVILKVNGRSISTTDDIWAVIEDEDLKPGDSLELEIYRDGSTLRTRLRLEAPPEG
jgi:serine protease Do